VPENYKALAFADMEIPLGEAEIMLAPKIEARMLQALNVQAHELVLEVGTGSGYFTALLAKLARHVFSVEIHANLSKQAKTKLSQTHISNVTLEIGNAANGWPTHAPYDVIAITGSLPVLPMQFKQELKIGGRLIAIVGEAPAMEVLLIQRLSENEWRTTSLFETVVPALLCTAQPSKFVF
jgi:protein-L-isoaspartate(D-aspartate) O-methyltransferase